MLLQLSVIIIQYYQPLSKDRCSTNNALYTSPSSSFSEKQLNTCIIFHISLVDRIINEFLTEFIQRIYSSQRMSIHEGCVERYVNVQMISPWCHNHISWTQASIPEAFRQTDWTGLHWQFGFYFTSSSINLKKKIYYIRLDFFCRNLNIFTSSTNAIFLAAKSENILY